MELRGADASLTSSVCFTDAEGGKCIQRARHQYWSMFQLRGRLSPGVFPEWGGKLSDSGEQHAWEDPHRWEISDPARSFVFDEGRDSELCDGYWCLCLSCDGLCVVTVTGASFVVFNGALKASSGFIAKSSIVEGEATHSLTFRSTLWIDEHSNLTPILQGHKWTVVDQC